MLSEYFDPLYFFIGLAVGMLVVYCITPTPEIVYKYPTPQNAGKVTYQDNAENCYKYSSKEVTCPKQEKEINIVPIQHVDLEEKSKESIITQFQKMINSKPPNNVILPFN